MASISKMSSLSLLLIFALCTSSSAASPRSDPPAFFYEVLPRYGLPGGLFPDSVNYTLQDDGSFELHLERPCYLTLAYYKVYYERKITGKLSAGSITNLKGALVKSFYVLWLNVNAVKVGEPAAETIAFSVWVLTVTLDINEFYPIRHCSPTLSLITPLPLSVSSF